MAGSAAPMPASWMPNGPCALGRRSERMHAALWLCFEGWRTALLRE